MKKIKNIFVDFEAFNSGTKEKWLEMALAVDYTVINFHGKDKLKPYIMALMNIVSIFFAYSNNKESLKYYF